MVHNHTRRKQNRARVAPGRSTNPRTVEIEIYPALPRSVLCMLLYQQRRRGSGATYQHHRQADSSDDTLNQIVFHSISPHKCVTPASRWRKWIHRTRNRRFSKRRDNVNLNRGSFGEAIGRACLTGRQKKSAQEISATLSIPHVPTFGLALLKNKAHARVMRTWIDRFSVGSRANAYAMSPWVYKKIEPPKIDC